MNIFKRMFHKHETQDVQCPYTGRTYIMCKVCNLRVGIR
jgi:hypothetical protein